jgi:Zinc finger, C3HC4 type (RING finger)
MLKQCLRFFCHICATRRHNVVVCRCGTCKHEICKECVLKLIRTRTRKCPYCRAKITEPLCAIEALIKKIIITN